MRTMKLVLITPLLLAGCAHKPPPYTPLYDAFQKYCVATGGQFEAVNKAATADGFKLLGEPVYSPFKIDSRSWQRGRDHISIGPLHRRKANADGNSELVAYDPPGTIAEHCTVTMTSEREESQASFAKWGVVPFARPGILEKTGDDINDSYSFRIENGKHLPVGRDLVAAVNAGGYWQTTYWKRGKEYGAWLHHFYLPAVPKAE
jgi:hypothetical protein